MPDSNHAKQNAKAWAESIAEYVYAMDQDSWDRLEGLREMAEDGPLDADDAGELAELEKALKEFDDADDAREQAEESALEVAVRSGWHNPTSDEPPAAEEFKILLSTGGPACRIMGELDENGEPSRAWLEYQDWGTPWTQYFEVSQDALLEFCRVFYFGE